MQKAKSILVKFLVLVLALCCSMAVMLGMTGCGAEDGKDGVGIQKVELNESTGKLEVTLTDGSKVVVDDQIVSTCGHSAVKEYQITEGTCVQDAEYLTVCDKDGGCGFAKISREPVADNHVIDKNASKYQNVYFGDLYGEDYPEIQLSEDKPACAGDVKFQLICECGEVLAEQASLAQHVYYEKGENSSYTTCMMRKCKFCNEVDEAYTNNHDAVYKKIRVVDDGANICEDGYQYVYVCETCFFDEQCKLCEGMIDESKTEVVPGAGHVVTAEWTKGEIPTFDSKGTITGYCEVCGTNATIEINKLVAKQDANGYDYEEVIAAGCETAGKDTYTITLNGVPFVYEVATSVAHKYNGVDMPLDKVYTAAEVGTVFGNAPATCKDHSGKGSFTCDVCNESYLVSISGNHPELTDADLIETKESVCIPGAEQGYKKYKCPVCEDEIIKPIAIPEHTWGEPVFDVQTYKLTFTCTVESCTGSKVIDCDAQPTITTDPATCAKAGSITYDFTYNNGTPDQFVVTLPQLKHYYGATTNEIDIYRTVPFTYTELKAMFGDNLVGLNTFGNSIADCSQSGNGAFECSSCRVEFLIPIMGDHDMVAGTVVAPTCTTDGYTVYTCSKHSDVTENRNIVSCIGSHDFEVIGQVQNVDGSVTISVKCTRDICDHYTEEITAENVREFTTPASCQADGEVYILYDYELDGTLVQDQKLQLRVLPKNADHKFGAHTITVDGVKVYSVAELKVIFGDDLSIAFGITLYGNAPASCQENGQFGFTCNACNTPYLVSYSGDHDWTDWTVIPANCVEDSIKYRTCQTAGCLDENEKVTTEYSLEGSVPALGHTYVVEAYTAPTVSAAGSITYKCSACDIDSITVEIPAAVYTIAEDGTVTVAEGYDIVSAVNATCRNEGVYKFSYVVKAADGQIVKADIFVEDTVEPIAHKQTTPPGSITWEKDGYIYTGHYCEDCGQIFVDTKVEKN